MGMDSSGNVYFADTLNETIRKITPTGAVTTIAGSPRAEGSTDGAGADARFLVPGGVAIDGSGNVFVADSGNDTIRKITPNGTVTTFAGAARAYGSDDGTGSAARFKNPSGIAIDAFGNLFVTDSGNHTIRKITPAGVVTTLAGSPGNAGTSDGSGTQARFNGPTGIAVDSFGNIYVADTENHAIRKVSPVGAVTTVAGTIGVSGSTDGTGTGAQFNEPYGIAIDSSGALYIADTTNDTIRRAVVASNAGSLQVTGVPPAKIQVATGTNVTLQIVASGSPSPSYQWFENGAAISGATSATLSLSSVTSANAGNYSAVVTSGSLTYSSGLTQLQVFSAGTVVPTVTIITQPSDQSVTAGQSVTFAVQATSSQSLSYQWTKNGANISGATGSSYTIGSAQLSDSAAYAVTINDGTTTVTTPGANLLVNASSTTTAPTLTTQPTSQSVTVGGSVTFTAAASGTPAPTFQWYKNGTALSNSSTISGATTATLSISTVASADAGNYTVVATNSVGTATSNAASLTVNPAPSGPTAWISNLSVRANMAAGQTMIVGFTVTGSGAQNVLVRAAGPGLAKAFPQFFTSSSVMADPNLALYANGASSATLTNDNWDQGLSSVVASVGAFPFDVGSKDAAFVQNISGANNTVWAQGTGGGYVLVEAYAVGASSSPRLFNISARNHVGTGADILIAGFVLQGTGNKTLLIRGIGPGLTYAFGLTGVLADPIVEVHDSADNTLASNNDWDSSLTTTFDQVGAYHFAAGSKDAAMIVTLPASPGGTAYTAQVKGNGGLTGEGVVEVYEVQP